MCTRNKCIRESKIASTGFIPAYLKIIATFYSDINKINKNNNRGFLNISMKIFSYKAKDVFKYC